MLPSVRTLGGEGSQGAPLCTNSRGGGIPGRSPLYEAYRRDPRVLPSVRSLHILKHYKCRLHSPEYFGGNPLIIPSIPVKARLSNIVYSQLTSIITEFLPSHAIPDFYALLNSFLGTAPLLVTQSVQSLSAKRSPSVSHNRRQKNLICIYTGCPDKQ